MSRYIDAEELISWIKESQQMTSKVRAIIAKILVMEDKTQEADVVEVVRCKNCKHWQENTEFCSKFSTLSVTHRMPPWAFCCLGERKEQGDE